ncbi:MAG TPA: RNA polymerase recycling motor HelD [Limnochordia bacterium]|nr:RNA polymerase recycling motor HelD [Limnochordia bacterium]
MLTPEEWAQEEARLKRTLAAIHQRLSEIEGLVKWHKDRVIATRRTMWAELPHAVESIDEAIQLVQHQKYLGEFEREYLIYRRLLPILERMASSPYFGRIDFREQGAQHPRQVYIGIASLVEPGTGEHLIYDWRAPISSMFYDYQPGPGSYQAQGGRVEGEILLKRQYKIAKGKLEYVFDTELTIEDELLQQILSQSADQKMRTIVQSIQREQNRAIRDEGHSLLIVQGPAGSGKTSIALHRVAYLLYRHRKTLSAKDIVVVSPNQVFNDYISDVLPDLGEENMQQTTFYQIVRAVLAKVAEEGIEIEDSSTHLEYLFGERGSPGYTRRVKEMQYKSSPAFFSEVQKYIQRLHQGQEIACPDIVYDGHVVISAGEIRELVTKTYSYLPYSKRLDKVGRRIHYLLEPFREERLAAAIKRIENDPKHQDLNRREIRQLARTLVDEEFRPIDQVIQQLTRVEVLRHYANVFRQPDAPTELQAIGEAVISRLAQGKIAYDDIAPILYLAAALGEIQGDRQIRHVVIDEAQDYSRFHYEVFRRLYPSATFTVLGDPAQSIHPYLNTVALETIEQTIAPGDAQVIRLNMTYRSTKEIVQFSRAIDPSGGGAHPIDRHGAKPLILEVTDPARLIDAAAAQARELHEAGARSVAIICKTAAQSQEVYAGLRERLPVRLVTADDDTLPRGDLVIPAYLAKGLEFDGVLIYDASANVYHDESERKLFYTACTRALHHLRLMYVGRLTPFLDDLSPGLAERAAFTPQV